MKKNGNCDKNSDNFLVEFKSTSKRSIVKKEGKEKEWTEDEREKWTKITQVA